MVRSAALWVRVATLFILFGITNLSWGYVDGAEVVPPGKGLVYVITRDTGSFGSVVVSVNGKVVATTASNSYVVVAVDPGQQRIGSAGASAASFDLSTVAGGIYYVQLRIRSNGNPEFRQLSASDGYAALAQSRKVGEVGTVPRAATTLPDMGASRTVTSATESRPNGGGRAFEEKQAVAIILKGGAYTVAEERQPMDGSTALLDTKAKSVFGLEVEWRHPTGFAVGGEVFYFRNKWTDASLGFSGQIDTATYGVTAKYYLGIADVVYPYVGVGAGYAVSAFSGDVTGSASGYAYQGLAGIEFRYKYVGLNIQYKKLNADVKSTNSLGQIETNPMGGSGPQYGLTIHIPIH